MHLVGFTIELYYDARSCERQIHTTDFFRSVWDRRLTLAFRREVLLPSSERWSYIKVDDISRQKKETDLVFSRISVYNHQWILVSYYIFRH